MTRRGAAVAHVLSSFALGGQERVALDLAAAQVARGLRVLAVSLAPLPHGVLAREFDARGVAVRGVEKGPGVDAATTFRLRALFAGEHVDVVHTHNPQPLIYAAPAARLIGATVIHTKHGANPDRGRRLWLRRAAGHLAHAYVAVSAATADVARRERECRPARLHVIENGIELASFGPNEEARRAVRRELGIPDDAWVFGTIGRVSPEKDHALLVRAAVPLLDARTWLVIVGDGAELGPLRTETRRLPHVVLTGVRRDVPRLLAAFDAFVLSSRSEGLPLALVEAMATALPIAATDVGGVRAVLDGHGALVRHGDDEALRAAMRALRDDPDRARESGRAARERALHFDAARMADAYLALYRTAR